MTSRTPYPYEPPRDQHGTDGGQAGPGGGGRDAGRRPGARRSRVRTYLPLAVAVWAVLEIWLLILVAEAAGGWAVLGLLVASWLIGMIVIKRAGRRAWSRLAESVQRAQAQAQGGRPPEPEQEGRGGNALVMLGGLLLMVPGLISDAAGLLCLFPPTATLLRRTTRRYLQRRSGFAPGTLGDAYQQARRAEEQMRMRRPDGKVVEGEVVEGDVVRDDERPPH